VTITAYRITKAAYAHTIWTGIGARDYGGRWNSKGVAVVYTAQNRALAAMEQLVHLVRPRLLKGYVIAGISFDDSDVHRLHPATLPPHWDDPVAPPALRKFGDDWVAAGSHLVLAVPSAVVREEWNFLVNPGHSDFASLAKSPAEPFVYDDRLG